jgi:hypothetical protein
MGQLEPPLSKSHIFFIGKDCHGNWVAQDQQHRCGGLFVGRAEALRFALFENGHQPQAVVTVTGTLELDMTDNTHAAHQPLLRADAAVRKQAA